jgi:hypothetical protein
MSNLWVDKENFGKLLIRLVLGVVLIAKDIVFFVQSHPTLTLLGKTLSIIGINLYPLRLGFGIAICYIICQTTVALGAFLKTSTFLSGTFTILEAVFKYHIGGDLVGEVVHVVILSSMMYGFMLIDSGSYSVQK